MKKNYEKMLKLLKFGQFRIGQNTTKPYTYKVYNWGEMLESTK